MDKAGIDVKCFKPHSTRAVVVLPWVGLWTQQGGHKLAHLGSFMTNLYREIKVSKGAKIRNRYNQVPHLTQDTSGKVTNWQWGTTNKSIAASPFPVGDHKVQINRRVRRHNKHKTEKMIHKRSTALERSVKIYYWKVKTSFTAPASSLIQMWIKTHRYKVCMTDP